MYDALEDAYLALSAETSLKKRALALSDGVCEPTPAQSETAAAIRRRLEALNAQAIFYGNDDYPPCLRELEAPPAVLYCRGSRSLLDDVSRIAVVGTRRPTRYGRDVTEGFVRALTQAGATIVSGMARGIDSAAHRVCLESGGRTIAVVGTGLDLVYPGENIGLAQRIIDNGLMISEYPPGTPPAAFRFPERNRLISALSCGVLIPEAGEKSGSLITAGFAVEQGRELYVVPGNVTSPQSKGSNRLLKELQATLVTAPEDVLGASGLSAARKDELFVQLSMEQERVLRLLDSEEKHFTELLEKSGLSVAELTALLTEMEIYGLIRKLNGNYYASVGRV